MTNTKQAFTPYTISKDERLFFSIPLYQRLFEWGEEQIVQLLDDLYSSYTRNCNSPYYIGMLTAKETGKNKELVDGQQRFTAMFLLGIYFGWKKFLYVSKETSQILRLQFTAREEDKEYLKAKVEGKEYSYTNQKMEKGLEYISTYLNKKLDKKQEKKFGEYIFHHLTFFLSELPDEYSSKDLNTYFERMNTSGKSLENYEILKVDIISRLSSNKENYTLLWNACSIMEKMILRKHNNEPLDKLRNRYKESILNIIENGHIDNAFEKPQTRFDIEEEDDSDDIDEITAPKTIGSIPISQENPYKRVKRRTDEHSLLTFPEFLLQVLYICLNKDIDEHEEDGIIIEGMYTTDFFDVRKLCETFRWAFNKRGLDAEKFMQKLGLCRLITDYFIIRMNDEDEEPYPFKLYKGEEKDKMKVRMFLAMLYSASSAMTYHMWMPELLTYLEDFVSKNRILDINASDYLFKLKEIDNKWHPFKDDLAKYLTYSTIDRYWFWRIDYYLWEQRELFFKEQDQIKVVEKYVFRRNRSIEHIAPQHPKDEFGDKNRFNWDDETLSEKRDCLGNMVMISSGQNSSLTNSCFEVKHTVMNNYASGKGHGTVESLKMLYVYSKYKNWSLDNIDEHQRFSIDFLKISYEKDTDNWKTFASSLS